MCPCFNRKKNILVNPLVDKSTDRGCQPQDTVFIQKVWWKTVYQKRKGAGAKALNQTSGSKLSWCVFLVRLRFLLLGNYPGVPGSVTWDIFQFTGCMEQWANCRRARGFLWVRRDTAKFGSFSQLLSINPPSALPAPPISPTQPLGLPGYAGLLCQHTAGLEEPLIPAMGAAGRRVTVLCTECPWTSLFWVLDEDGLTGSGYAVCEAVALRFNSF